MNPLHNAIIKRQHGQLAKLLAAGADTSVLTANGRNARELAEFVGNLPALVLLEGEQVLLNAPDSAWIDALRRGDYQLEDIPAERLTAELCDEVLLATPQRLQELPADYRQPAILRERCRRNPALLKVLPAGLLGNPEFYRPLLPALALDKWPRPWPQEMIDHALQLDPRSYTDLDDNDKTTARSQDYIRYHSNGLLRVPENQRSYELCLAAMQSGYALDQVPPHLLDDRLTGLAVGNLQRLMANHSASALLASRLSLPTLSAELLALIPPSERSFGICLAAVAWDYHALQYVPEQHKTLELCCAALNDRELIGMQINDICEMIPEPLRDQVLAQATFQHHIQPGEFEDWDWD